MEIFLNLNTGPYCPELDDLTDAYPVPRHMATPNRPTAAHSCSGSQHVLPQIFWFSVQVGGGWPVTATKILLINK